jgi:hypothetical protein
VHELEIRVPDLFGRTKTPAPEGDSKSQQKQAELARQREDRLNHQTAQARARKPQRWPPTCARSHVR